MFDTPGKAKSVEEGVALLSEKNEAVVRRSRSNMSSIVAVALMLSLAVFAVSIYSGKVQVPLSTASTSIQMDTVLVSSPSNSPTIFDFEPVIKFFDHKHTSAPTYAKGDPTPNPTIAPTLIKDFKDWFPQSWYPKEWELFGNSTEHEDKDEDEKKKLSASSSSTAAKSELFLFFTRTPVAEPIAEPVAEPTVLVRTHTPIKEAGPQTPHAVKGSHSPVSYPPSKWEDGNRVTHTPFVDNRRTHTPWKDKAEIQGQ